MGDARSQDGTVDTADEAGRGVLEMTGETGRRKGPRRGGVVTALGLAQILAWGSTYYLPAVLAKPMADDTGWPLVWVIGGLSVGLLVAGLASPRVGRVIQANGGRRVLVFAAIILALGLSGIAASTNIAIYLAAWGVLGLGMAAGLYDAAFATLGRIYGAGARAAITTLTLFGGFASTICWPLSAILLRSVGWRGACLVYAGLHLGMAMPAHLRFIRASTAYRPEEKAPPAADGQATVEGPWRAAVVLSREQTVLFVMLAASLTLGSVITSVMSVHLLTILQARGVTLAAAVGYGTLVGPSQVAARVYELAIGRRFHPTWTYIVAGCLLLSGVTVLLMAFPLAGVGLVLYGGGVGVMTIARGTLPLVLFDPSGYAVLLGRLALPSLLAQAIAPALAAVLVEHGGAGRVLGVIEWVALLNLALVVGLRGMASQQKVRP